MPMEILHHNITTVNLKLDGDYAEGEVYVQAFHQVDTEDGPSGWGDGFVAYASMTGMSPLYQMLHDLQMAEIGNFAPGKGLSIE